MHKNFKLLIKLKVCQKLYCQLTSHSPPVRDMGSLVENKMYPVYSGTDRGTFVLLTSSKKKRLYDVKLNPSMCLQGLFTTCCWNYSLVI